MIGEEEAKPCPFCLSPDTSVNLWQGGKRNEYGNYHVVCTNCGAQGPEALWGGMYEGNPSREAAQKEAVQLWNKSRPREEKHEPMDLSISGHGLSIRVRTGGAVPIVDIEQPKGKGGEKDGG